MANTTDYKFKSGDVISRTMDSGRTWIGIFKRYGEQGLFDSYCFLSDCGELFCEGAENHYIVCRPATEGEKQKLFKEIEKNGYRWNDKEKCLEELNKVAKEIKITEKKTLVKKVLLTVPKEWEICGADDGNGTFAIVIQVCTPHRMEALAEALKSLSVIGRQKATTFVLSPEWEIDYAAHTGETLTLKKFKYEYEYHEN